MITVTKIDDKNFVLNENGAIHNLPTTYEAAESNSGIVVLRPVINNGKRAFQFAFGSVEINGAIPATPAEAVKLLNAFVGNFWDGGGSEPPEQEHITFDPDPVIIPQAGGMFNPVGVDVIADGEWTTDDVVYFDGLPQDFSTAVVVMTTSGAEGTTRVNIYTNSPNMESVPRTATLSFKMGGVEVATLQITQEGIGVIPITFSPNPVNLTNTVMPVSVKVIANDAWTTDDTVYFDGFPQTPQNRLMIDPSGGTSGNTQIDIRSLQPNPTGAPRTATLSFKMGGVEVATLTVIQSES